MRTLLVVSGACLVVLFATWTYRVNYSAQEAANRLADLKANLSREREAMSVLRAEWAFLNRPDRLSALVSNRGGDLGLVPIVPEQFGEVANVAFPPEPGGTDAILSASSGEP
jgi:hypothetical protein